MARATLIASADSPSDMGALLDWFRKWRSQLVYVSPNSGCGCCVQIFDVEGPEPAMIDIPYDLNASSDWVTSGRKSTTEMGPTIENLLREGRSAD